MGLTNPLIYYYFLKCFFKASSDLIFFCGWADRSKEYCYLFLLSFKKNIGHLWFQLFLGGGQGTM